MPTDFPALPEQPALRPANHERIVRLADWPHPRLALQLRPVGERDRGREGMDEPGARQPRLILAMVPPVPQDVPDRVTRLRRRLDHRQVIPIGEHLVAPPALAISPRRVDVPRGRDQQVYMAALQADVYDPEPLA